MQQSDLTNANGQLRDPGNPTTGNLDVTNPGVVSREMQTVVEQLESRTEPVSENEIAAAFAVVTIFAAAPASVLLAFVLEAYDIAKDVQRCKKNDNGANDKYGTINCFPLTRVSSTVLAALGIALMAHYCGSRHTVPPQGSLRTTSEHMTRESSYHSSANHSGHPDGINLDYTVAPTVRGSTAPDDESAGTELQSLDPTASAQVTWEDREIDPNNPFQDPPPPYLRDN
ncbi:hypothetical protein QFC21_006907 [Naganishia friedmannii]|uniref:Uncharacterized protein n=1 Tax=Naganishia friedmannii TaxID=89922 RepID=A0ACC2V008_9TREE|nr:hypothetical protein QFC21_006907 [Naganishia friedmannii]